MERLFGKSRTAQHLIECFSELSEVGCAEHRFASTQFEVVKTTYRLNRSATRTLFVDPNQLVLSLNIEGSELITKVQDRTTRMVYPNTITLLRAGEYRILDGAGGHSSRLLIVGCHSESLTGLEVLRRVAQHGKQVIKLSPREVARLLKLLDHSEDYFELAHLYYGLLARVFEERQVQPADSIPDQGPLEQLCQALQKEPHLDWTNATAARFCGYSLYHFSRTFKDQFGLGFPSFVEELRVEGAVKMLLNGIACPELVARQVGFSGSTKLSSAMKSRLGLCLADFKGVSKAA